MTDLTDFLLARIAEGEFAWGVVAKRDTTALLYGKPIAPRMLAMCAAHRRIVDMLTDRWDDEAMSALEEAVRSLAAVYADHVDYRQEWKP